MPGWRAGDRDLQGPDPTIRAHLPVASFCALSEPNSRRPRSHSHISSAICLRNVRESGGNRAELWLESRTIGRSLAGRRSNDAWATPSFLASQQRTWIAIPAKRPVMNGRRLGRGRKTNFSARCYRLPPNLCATTNPRRQEPLSRLWRLSAIPACAPCVPPRPASCVNCAVNEPLGLALINPRHERSLPFAFWECTICNMGDRAKLPQARSRELSNCR